MNIRNYLLSALLIAVSGSASASDFFSTEKSDRVFSLGIRAGVNTSNRTVASKSMEGYNVQSWGTGTDLGIVADLNIREYISIQPGIFFESRSGNYTFVTPFSDAEDVNYVTQAGHLRSYALTIPVLASFHFNITDDIRWDVDFGPYLSVVLGSDLSDKALTSTYGSPTPVTPVFSQKPAGTDFGLKMGTGLRILGHYYVGVHYQAGMTGAWKDLRIDDHNTFSYGGRTKAWVFSIGYDF